MTRVLAVAIALTLTAIGAGAAAADQEQARFDFMLNCSGCHGSDATGSATVPPLDEGLARLLASAEGRSYLIRVPGVAQAPLSDARLARLMNFVVTELARAPVFEPYTPAEVAPLRRDPLRAPRRARPSAPE